MADALLTPSPSDLTFAVEADWLEEDLSAAVEAVFKHGVVHLDGAVVPDTLLLKIRKQAAQLCEETCRALDALGIDYRTQTQPFSFREAASRCRGRVDVRHPFLANAPFNDARLVANPTLEALLDGVLGPHKLAFMGIVQSLPGAEAQGWHMDGDHLFTPWQLPPHAVTVFVYLADLAEEQGIPEFITGSHLQEQYQLLQQGVEAVPIYFRPRAGSITVFDYRTVHRGTPNVSQGDRPLLYMVYSKPWFQDTVNFSDRRLFKSSSNREPDTINGHEE
jgi:hypothetical protein